MNVEFKKVLVQIKRISFLIFKWIYRILNYLARGVLLALFLYAAAFSIVVSYLLYRAFDYGYKIYDNVISLKYVQPEMSNYMKALLDSNPNFEIKHEMLDLISYAKKSVTILMAYIGDKDITGKIIEIANKGINVTILLPEKANLQNDLNMKTLKSIMRGTNNKINAYLRKKMVHAKMIIIDDEIVTFGSCNINKNSMTKLSELNILINTSSYKEFDEKLKLSLEENFKNTIKITDANMINYNPAKALIEQII